MFTYFTIEILYDYLSYLWNTTLDTKLLLELIFKYSELNIGGPYLCHHSNTSLLNFRISLEQFQIIKIQKVLISGLPR